MVVRLSLIPSTPDGMGERDTSNLCTPRMAELRHDRRPTDMDFERTEGIRRASYYIAKGMRRHKDLVLYLHRRGTLSNRKRDKILERDDEFNIATRLMDTISELDNDAYTAFKEALYMIGMPNLGERLPVFDPVLTVDPSKELEWSRTGQEGPRCALHRRMSQRLACMDCLVPVCGLCIVYDHSTHWMVEDDYFDTLKAFLPADYTLGDPPNTCPDTDTTQSPVQS